MTNNVMNFVNFIRGIEPRCEMDLLTPVKEELKLALKYDFPATWLIQYDALMNSEFVELLKSAPESHEIGIWLEIVEPLTNQANIPWRGRFPWDWHTHVGFSVGYSPAERIKMLDIFMEKFKSVFGYYPQSIGSWLLDAVTLKHAWDKYHISASCICRDQWGTDGYTLWGGYYANGYYPSKNNSFLPAQSLANQINVPVFRMLGSDTIYQHEAPVDPQYGQRVITLEPVYKDIGGGVPEWVDYFLRNNIAEPHLAMSYAQFGQENSFGWAAIKDGLIDQCEKISKMRDKGLVRVETLSESGKWFKYNFAQTPSSAIVTLEDYQKNHRQALWYLSKNYRMKFTRTEQEYLIIQDWQVFSEKYPEPYLNSVCPTPSCIYDALPVVDNVICADATEKSMIEIIHPKYRGEIQPLENENKDNLSFVFTDGQKGNIYFELTPDELKISSNCPIELKFNFVAPMHGQTSARMLDKQTLKFTHRNFEYQLEMRQGTIEKSADKLFLKSDDNNTLVMQIKC